MKTLEIIEIGNCKIDISKYSDTSYYIKINGLYIIDTSEVFSPVIHCPIDKLIELRDSLNRIIDDHENK